MPDRELPLGPPVEWSPVPVPRRAPLVGSRVTLRPVRPDDAEDLYAESHPPDGDPTIWTYLAEGPFDSPTQMRAMLERAAQEDDRLFFVIGRNSDQRAVGVASYMRMEPAFGVIEIGNIWFGVSLRRTAAATEAIFLLAQHVLDDLGYRRLEWKCNALNAASRRAAERFGFTFEGIFRRHQVVKGRNRDTAWYAIVEDDWPSIRGAYEAWLAPANFDDHGRQRQRLGQLMPTQR
jgi:RimJ/RimL family protein N-acetyltransferase